MGKKIESLLKIQKIYGINGLFLEFEKFKESEVIMSPKLTKEKLLEKLAQEVKNCKLCPLWKTRVNIVFGEGNINAELMFVGEGPGYEEDKQARPFVGRAGELLTKIISAMKLSRNDVYIANIVKCHPLKEPDPYLRNNDRPPNEDEIKSCLPYLEKQIEIIYPKIICCLGSTSAKVLTRNDLPITELRGKIFDYYKDSKIKILPTYHPAALLRNPSLKKFVWQDMQLIMKMLGIDQ